MSSLCFYDAAIKRRDNEITEDVYLQSLLAHCTGVRHGKNRLCNNDMESKEADDVTFAHNVKAVDRFAADMSSWTYYNTLKNTAPLLATLKAYRSNNSVQLKSSIPGLDEAYESWRNLGPYLILGPRDRSRVRWSLCQKLATLALEDQNTDMLKVILEVHGTEVDMDFHRIFDDLKHDGDNPQLVRLVESSGYESIVPSGMRFSEFEQHPLNIWA